MAKTNTAHLALLTAFGLGCGAASSPAQAPADKPGGAELWGMHCGRCHNARSPSTASDADWEVIALHMRIRANLTAEDTQTILDFLRSGN